jgi:hypothetical protein
VACCCGPAGSTSVHERESAVRLSSSIHLPRLQIYAINSSSSSPSIIYSCSAPLPRLTHLSACCRPSRVCEGRLRRPRPPVSGTAVVQNFQLQGANLV